jgi:hypothetical protein
MMFNWGAIGQGVAGTVQSVVGLMQKNKAKKLRQRGERLQKEAWEKRTDFEIPQEIRDQYIASQNQAYGKPALQQYMEDAADQTLSGNLSAVKRYATSGADALAAATTVNQQSMSNRAQAAMAGEQARQQNMATMYNAGNLLADYKSMAWDMNVNVPFLQRLQWAQDLQGAGYQGENDAMNTFIEGQNQIGQSVANFFGGGGGGGGGMMGGMGGGANFSSMGRNVGGGVGQTVGGGVGGAFGAGAMSGAGSVFGG